VTFSAGADGCVDTAGAEAAALAAAGLELFEHAATATTTAAMTAHGCATLAVRNPSPPLSQDVLW